MANELEDTGAAVAAALNPVQNDPATAAKASMSVAVDANPDFEAELRRAAQRTGVPIDAARTYPEDVKKQATLSAYNFDDMAQQFPSTVRFLANPDNARIAHDDTDNMGLLETLANSFKRGVPGLKEVGSATALRSNAMSLSNIDSIEKRLAAGEKPDVIPDGEDVFGVRWMNNAQREALKASLNQSVVGSATNIAGYEAEKKKFPQPAVVDQVMASKTFKEAIGNFMTDPIKFIGSVGPESLVSNAPGMIVAIPAGIFGGPAAGATVAGAGSFATDYGSSILEALGDEKVDINNPEAVIAASRDVDLMKRVAKRAVTHATIVGAVDTISGSIAGKAALPARAGSTMAAQPIKRELANVAAQVPVQGALGGLGEAAGEIASGQDISPGNILAEIVGEAFTAPAEVMSISGKEVVQRVRDARQAEQNGKVLEQINSIAAASKLRERDPESFQAFVREATADGPVQDVYVNAATFAQSLQEAGVDVNQVAQVSPAVAAQLQEAITAGGDIQIPIDEYATHIAGTDAGAALLQHLKTEPAGMTQAEATAFMQSQGEELKAAVDRTLAAQQQDEAFKASRDAVSSEVLNQLKSTRRFTDDVNNAYASMMGNFYAVTAAKLGITPAEMLQRYPLQVNAERLVGAKTLDQPAQVALAPNAEQDSPGGADQEAGSATAFDQSAGNTTDQSINDQGTLNKGTRGSITFGDDITQQPSVITLLQNADLSTFLHESGHFFLEVTNDIANRPDAPESVKQDMDALLKWFGVPDLATWNAMDIEGKRPYHEQLARGFEAYLFEGNAPNIELQSLFQKFRAWMLSVYRSLTSLHVNLTDEVRGVFGRMLASSETIAEAEQIRSYGGLFTSKPDFMTDAEWLAYQNLGNDATQEAVHQLESRSLRDMQWLSNAKSKVLGKLQRDAADKRKAVRREVETEVMAEPINQARTFLKRGTATVNGEQVQVAEGHKLNIAAIKEIYPDTALNSPDWQKLGYGKYGMLGTEGLHPDLVAEMFGFSSGDEMVRTLLDAQGAREKIEAVTDQRMLERFGDITDPASIAKAADAALHNDARIRFVATELNALNKAVGARPVLAKAAKAFAEAAITRKKVRDLRPSQYAAAAARAAKASDKAFKAGDIETAATEKRNQLVNSYADRAAHAAQDEAQKTVDYLKKFDREATRKNLDADYIDQIDALLERFDLRKGQSLKAIDKRAALADWIEAQREQGLEPDISPEMVNEAFRKSYKDMTVEELRGLRDTIKQIEHLGRLKHKLLTAKDQRAYEVIRDEIAASIEEHAGNRTADTRTPTTNIGRTVQGLKRFWAAHIKVATWARVMDGGKDGGPVWEYFIRNANEAGDRETQMRADSTKALSEILAPVFKLGKMGGKGAFFPVINRSLNRESRIAIALNVGNESNLQRLLGGEGWNRAQLQPVLDSLTKEEWNAVQAIWDHFESYRPQIAAKERRIYGKEPDWVEPTPIMTPHGEYRGGYYPVKYDPAASQRAEEHADAEGAKRQLQGAYTTATTRRSFTKTRAEAVVGRPLLYSLAGLYSGVNDVIHDLSWHEWLIDVNRLMRSNTIDTAIRSHYGPEAKAQFKSWIADVAEGEKAAANAGEVALSKLRQNVSAAGLGYNVMSASLQGLGMTQSIVRVGATWMARGVSQYLAHPIDATRSVNEKSSFMASRSRTRYRELNELRNRVQGESTVGNAIKENAYLFMMRCQQVVDTPTWLGAYEKAIAEGNAEDRAISLADQAVIDAQGGGQTKDLSAIERGGPALKLFTSFYSFMNTALNIGVAQTMTSKSKGKLAVDYLMLYSVPAVLGFMLKNAFTPGDSGDDDDLGKLALKLAGEQIGYLMGLMVVTREFAEVAKNMIGANDHPRDYSGPAGVRIITDTFNFGKQASQGDFDDSFRKAAINLTGDLLGLPSAQINRTVTGAQALTEGKTENPAALAFGFQEKR